MTLLPRQLRTTSSWLGLANLVADAIETVPQSLPCSHVVGRRLVLALSSSQPPNHPFIPPGTHPPGSISSPLPTPLPPLRTSQNLLPQHLLHNPQIIRLPINNILQLLDIRPQLLYLAIVEFLSIIRSLLHVETRPDVDDDVRGVGELAGDVEGGCQGDEEGFV